MLQWLKDHFIPSPANDHQPHFLRTKIVAGLIALVFAVELLYLASSFILLPASDYFAAIFASVLVQQTNEERATESLGTLTVNEKLIEAAQMKADDMSTRGYFAHVAPDGKNPWYWFKQVGYNYAAAGENLAVNFTDSKDVTEAWMHSPSHRSNIMGANYTEIGIATARGTYKGKDAIFVVQMFGRPSLVAKIPESPTTTTISSVGAKISATAPASEVASAKTEGVNTQKEVTPPQPKILAVAGGVPTTTIVAGAETIKMATPDGSSQILESMPIAETVAASPTVTASEPRSAKIANVLTSPRQTTNTLYAILAILVTIALGLAIFIKFHIQYPHIIRNGLLILAVIALLLILNNLLNLSGGIV